MTSDPNDVLAGKGMFMSQEAYTSHLSDDNTEVPSLQVLRPDYYDDAGAVVNVEALGLSDIYENQKDLFNYNSPNTLHLNKNIDNGHSTYDDGLLFRFPMGKYEHLTYYCRT